jgi:hypothetical protein
MVPRGEVGLIFATIGKSLGVVNDNNRGAEENPLWPPLTNYVRICELLSKRI